MLLGVAVGTAATLLVSAGSRGGAAKLLDASGSRAKSARRWAGRRAKRGARWMSDRGDDLRDKLPSMDDVSGELKDYLSAARDTISDTVSDELRDLRKAVRRQRKRIGV
jgi:gas vesicle protein